MKSSTRTVPTAPPVPERQAWLALSALCVGLFMTLLDQSLVAVALPQIREHFDAGINETVWVVAVYLLAFAAPLLVTGRLGDRFGQRRIYLIGMAVFLVAALACVLAPSIEWLIAARAVQGLGGSLINPQPLSIINRVFARSRRGAAMGVWSAVAGSSGLFGPVVGGLLAGTAGWRWVFFLYVPLGLVAMVLVSRWVPRLPTGTSRIDVVGASVSLVAILAVVFTVQQGPELDWPGWLWLVLAGGIAAFGFFAWLQRRADRIDRPALVPPALFSYRNFAFGSVAVFTLGFSVYSANVPIMLYLQSGAGLSSQTAGLLIMPMALTSVLLAPIMGRFADRLPPGRISKIGFTAMIGALTTFAILMRTEVPVGWLVCPLVLMGVANALCWSSNSAISMRQLPVTLVGAGSGVYNSARQIGAVVGTAAVGAAMQIGVANTGFAAAMGNSLLLAPVVLLVGLAAASRFRTDDLTDDQHV